MWRDNMSNDSDKPVDPGQEAISPHKDKVEAEVSIGFATLDDEGNVANVDIYVVPQKEFELMPEWATPSEYRQMCEQHRCIAVDTIFTEEK
jgi:hypothetical protein